ncbi:hypothetical protein Pmgp_02778 [Pelotomaculum propionicicum]|uniref:Uncharacterized protein n=2 Tax=Pelotomaculum propionicicum TaxID=258475 RepID=A0A4Y7RMA3_9FIRM|nr:hypothetical protein Pmgp_02778 [Pelotomaculum propionicicum]
MIQHRPGNKYLKMKEELLKMKKEIKNKEDLKSCAQPETNKTGYQEVWDTGRVSAKKKKGKVTGINRPSV